jgi:hypothetical protein
MISTVLDSRRHVLSMWLWILIKNAFSMIFQSKIVKNRPQVYLLTEIHDMNSFGLGTARTFDVDCGFSEKCIFEHFSVETRQKSVKNLFLDGNG